MRKIFTALTFLRRVLLFLLLAVLIPTSIDRCSNDGKRGINDHVREVQADGSYTEMMIDRSFSIDDDTLTVDKAYVTPKRILLTYTYRHHNRGYSWSFPESTLKLILSDGQQLNYQSGGSSGRSWGQRGQISFLLPKDPIEKAKLVYDWYDRHAELDIPLTKAGSEQ
ncbi:hypothetical protein ACFPPD_26635 [Cohnella suwonensis]|uniref:DUF4352 domain-containing protein n=1 Tax=Cohnella suwonensis TaxID=696072 RepID=A0ABW0M5Q4_9BACL